MRILAIGSKLELGDLYLSLMREGHDVRVHAGDPAYAGVFDGLATKVDDWRAELALGRAGRAGLLRTRGRRAPSRTRCGPTATR